MGNFDLNWVNRLLADNARLRAELAGEQEDHINTQQAFYSATREAVKAQKAIARVREVLAEPISQGVEPLRKRVLRALEPNDGASG